MDDHSLDCLDFHRVRDLLAGCAQSGLGRSLAAAVRPVSRLALVRRWLNQVAELQRLSEDRGLPPFGGISDVREVLMRCAPPLRVSVEEVARIGATLEGTHAVADYLRDLPEDCPEFTHLANRVGDFRNIAERIRTVIDERGQVRDDASPKLHTIRNEINEARAAIHSTIQRLLTDPAIRKLLQFPNHTFHGDRLVLPVRGEYRGRLEGIVHRSSDSGATIYVEPAAVVELNNRISNLRAAEVEEVNRLLWDLAHEIHLNGREIRKTLDTLAVIDLVVAKVRFAKDFGLRCPELSAEGQLNVRNARHPLLIDLAKRRQKENAESFEVIPIDYRLGHDFTLLIITGPNTGGKTVTIKTIGLLSLMVQAGIPIPCDEGSEVGVFTHVLIDVGDEQSMQQSLSTFSGHMTRILDMLRRAAPRTLILIDELGAGTDPDEGAALGRALLDELVRLHCRCVVTTHLGALKSFALTRSNAENACVDFDSDTLRPTYHLRIGEPGQSNAIEIAQRLGMSKRLIGAARRNMSKRARALQSALESTRVVKRKAEDARRGAEDARVQATAATEEANAARARFEQRQAEFHQWVQRVVHLQAGDAVRVRDFDRDGKIVRLRLDQQRAEVDVGAFSVEVPLGDVLPPEAVAPPPRVRPAPPTPPTEKRPRKAEPRRETRPAKPPGADGAGQHAAPPKQKPQREQPRHYPDPPALTTEQAAALQPLDTVFVRRFHREGRVVRIKPGGKEVVVSVGMLEIEVPLSGLARPLRPKAPTGKTTKPAKRPTPPSDDSAEAKNNPAPAPQETAKSEAETPATPAGELPESPTSAESSPPAAQPEAQSSDADSVQNPPTDEPKPE